MICITVKDLWTSVSRRKRVMSNKYCMTAEKISQGEIAAILEDEEDALEAVEKFVKSNKNSAQQGSFLIQFDFVVSSLTINSLF